MIKLKILASNVDLCLIRSILYILKYYRGICPNCNNKIASVEVGIMKSSFKEYNQFYTIAFIVFIIITSSCVPALNTKDWNARFVEAKQIGAHPKVYTELAHEALKNNDNASFKKAAAAGWEAANKDPEAKMALTIIKINNEEDYENLLKKTYAASLEKKKSKAEKREEAIAAHTITINQSLDFERINIIVNSVGIKQLEQRQFFYITGKMHKVLSDNVLCVNIKITNITEGQVFAPISRRLLETSYYTDEFNNKHNFPIELNSAFKETPKAINIDKEIKPGESLESCIPFEVPKVDNSKNFVADIYIDTFVNRLNPDRSKAVILNFSRKDLTKQNN